MAKSDPLDRITLPFTEAGASERPSAAQKQKYVDDLLSFLRDSGPFHRSHPEDFFQPGFLDQEQRPELLQWCRVVGDLCISPPAASSSGETSPTTSTSQLDDYSPLSQLLNLSLVKNVEGKREGCGQPSSSASVWDQLASRDHRLFSFARECWRLRLNRLPSATTAAGSTPTADSEAGEESRLVNEMTSTGMATKKQHEARIMYRQVMDQIRKSPRPVEVVINVGEGKGYVSRLLATIGGIPVMGLDCNPNHRDTAFKRGDRSLFASSGEEGFAIAHRCRGDCVSVTCRVESDMNWGQVIPLECQRHLAVESEAGAVDGLGTSSSSSLAVEVGKVQCTLCGRVSVGHLPLLLHHVVEKHYDAFSKAGYGNGLTGDLKKQQQFAATLFHAFATPAPTQKKTTGEADEADEEEAVELDGDSHVDPLRKRFRESPSDLEAGVPPAEPDDRSDKPTQKNHYARATRLTVRSDVFSKAPATTGEGVLPPEYEDVVVLGYDDSSAAYKLLRLRTKTRYGSVRLNSTDVKCVVPVPAPVPCRIDVQGPLSNAIAIGLHTCGNLGANICRLWISSRSSNLFLVSCCWHALTEQGFPLSRSISSSGISLSSLSLMLATQPYTEGLAASAIAGYLSSKRLLFYRALLPLFLSRGTTAPAENAHPASTHSRLAPMNTDDNCCAQSKLVNTKYEDLSPAFLRRISKHKGELTFVDFVRAYVEETAANGANGGVPPSAAELSAAQAIYDTHAHRFSQFLGFIVLRMWLAPLVEGMLLIDRTLFLAEEADRRGEVVDIHLEPVFDPYLSPRNMVIRAVRQDKRE